MSHYDYKSIPDAKFEFGGFFSFGDMTSQNFPWKKETSDQIRLFTPRKMGLSFYVQNHSCRPKIDPLPCQFQQFPSEGKFFIL